ncbi:MAG: RNA polymerase sigma factor [Acidimicrobiia bacterium]|nr:RNA polymerase sigma factor [Acidimicrobiia bacterium]MDQ3501349.1 RNA polymerase sigma factor [Actinomycetota bacterium]
MDSVRVMRRLAAGDPNALNSLYGQYGRSVFTVCYRALGDRSLAEEASQQTFLQAWRAARTFEVGREPGPWLYAIARRAAVDAYRRERRHRADRLDDPEIVALPPSFEGMWEAWEVRRAIDLLTHEEAQVIKLTYLDGLSHEEAASQLGIPLGTVKSRSARARKRLSTMLAHLKEATA